MKWKNSFKKQNIIKLTQENREDMNGSITLGPRPRLALARCGHYSLFFETMGLDYFYKKHGERENFVSNTM